MNDFYALVKWVVSIAIIVVSLRAQDITVAPPAWVDARQTDADALPSFRTPDRPNYTDSCPPTDQLGYVYFAAVLDAKGHVDNRTYFCSFPYFNTVVSRWFSSLEFQPATKTGKHVWSYVWVSILFNPESAKATGPDATPRLLAVAPAVVPSDLLNENIIGRPVWARFTVDASGAPQDIILDEPGTEKFREAIEEALKSWKFVPARKDGHPCATELHLPIAVQGNEARTLPQPTRQTRPYYPSKFEKEGGKVGVSFEVSPKGTTINVTVVNSTNPGLNQMAVEAVRDWEFKPATVNGKPVAAKAFQVIDFPPVIRTGLPIKAGVKVFNDKEGNPISAKTFQSSDFTFPDVESVGEFRPTGPKFTVINAPSLAEPIAPVYPYAFLRDGISGSANVRYQVNTRGEIDGDDVLESSRPEFAFALTAAIEATPFAPKIVDGQPVVLLTSTRKTFKAEGLDGFPSEAELSMLDREKNRPGSIVSAKKLDAPLKPAHRSAPVFPHSALGRMEQGNALVEAIIDEEGSVRLPRVVSASDPAFGYAAAQAAAGWKFEPPLAGGKPVAVRVSIPFKFQLDAAEPDHTTKTNEAPATTAP